VLDLLARGPLAAEVVAVVSQRRSAGALLRAEVAEISTAWVPFGPYRDAPGGRVRYERDLAGVVASFEPDWILCLGWMHVLGTAFLDRFPGRVVNLHPALPGAMPGRDAIERTWAAWQAGDVTSAGVMMHVVVPELDAGPVLAVRAVPLTVDDTFDSFEARMHDAEHELVADVVTALVMAEQPGD
jgi:formyltetrahydrofolate-dependent phosphoribosylglycinamide formyltransferase